MSRWFLNESETNWLAHCDIADRGNALIRLWTVKEAVFKCQADNRGYVLTDFTIADPSSNCCEVRSADGRRFRCVSFPLDGGILSIAVPGRRQ